MATNMHCEKNSLAMLSSKRTKAFSKSRADEAFALPSFSDAAPTFSVESSLRSGREPKAERRLEHHVNDVEMLKQTMLHHESMFKEQLYELHRLYRVQKLLMEESTRKSLAASHSHSHSPPSNGSLLYNLGSCRVKEESRFWEASNASRSSKQLPFFAGKIDVNTPCEDKHFTERLVIGKHIERPIIDLEQPADEHTEMEAEDVKRLVKNSYFQPVRNTQPPVRTSWQDPECSVLLGKNASMAMCERKGNTMCTESTPSSSKWSSFVECFTTEHSGRMEVPLFSMGSSSYKHSSAEGSNLPSSLMAPATSVFGVNLMREINNKDVHSSAHKSNLGEKRRELHIAGSNACDKSTGQASKLPHWLLQGLQTTSATNTSLINSDRHQRQHQTSSSLLQKQNEKTSCIDERVSFMYAQQERFDIQVKGGGFPFGENLLKAPHCKSSSEYFFNPSMGNVQGLHKLGQTSSANDSVTLLLPSSVEGCLGMSPKLGTNHSSSPFVVKKSSNASSAFLEEFSSNRKHSRSPVLPPYQQWTPSVMPQVSRAGAQNQRPSNAFVNPSSSWGNVPAHEQVQDCAFIKSTHEAGESDSRGTSGFSPSRPEVSSKRLIFGYMPTAADLDLTLGLDLDDNEAMGRMQQVDDSLSNEHLAQRPNGLGLRSEPVGIDFDLNEVAGQVMDAERETIPTETKRMHEDYTGIRWGTATGMKPPYQEWQTSHNSSSLKAIPEETIASTVTPRQQCVTSILQTDRHEDAADDEQLDGDRVNRSLKAGRSSDGSGLTSCESRSTPTPALNKTRDDSTFSEEDGQILAVRQLSKKVLFNSASTVFGMRQGLSSSMLILKSSHAPAGNAKASTGKVEASKAADVLLLLSLDLPLVMSENKDVEGDEERALKWLADIIPQDDMPCMDGGGKAGLRVKETVLRGSIEGIGAGYKVPDAFELAVLSLKPINPDSETICTKPIEKFDVAEECLRPSSLRRRSLRRGRAGKDFQKEMLPSIASLSRQEITEDLQIIEGLVKSATEAMARCSLSSKEDVSWSLPALSLAKTPSKAKDFRTCKAGKQNVLLRACSWGETTRRPRMRRQRRVCLPLGY